MSPIRKSIAFSYLLSLSGRTINVVEVVNMTSALHCSG